MKRRKFVAGMTAAFGLAACGKETEPAKQEKIFKDKYSWNMVTSWPPNLPGLGTGANKLAEDVFKASDGRLSIKVFAGGELVPPLQVFDAVSQGTAQIGHDSSYYHRGKLPAAPYFTTVPFGMNVNETNAWLYFGGGIELWHELYEPFDLVPFPVGNTGVQMLGWFNKEISSIEDIKGLKIRMPGLGGEIMQRAGAVQVTMAGSEIFTSLQTGAIDAAEWVGPYNDVSLGLHKAAKYYYYPGFHEPGPNIECIINTEAWSSLPPDLQKILEIACQSSNLNMTSEYMWGNAVALEQLKKDPNIQLKQIPQAVFNELKKHSKNAIEDLVSGDRSSEKIQQSIESFMEKSSSNQEITELSYLDMRIRSEI
ncbi:MAG: ABC transporter substrate-binding protein [Woeseiaceae bacterium]|nr:ABC transporter substrate-binding protein [Woeseiaceae bacterium]